jgi:hypothetical protein
MCREETERKRALNIKNSPLAWKDADRDIAIFRQAKTEYDRLQ